MAHDLHLLVRAAYNNAMLQSRNTGSAFNRAVEVMMQRRPLLNPEEARSEVASMLAELRSTAIGC
jgi:hypothetical protein